MFKDFPFTATNLILAYLEVIYLQEKVFIILYLSRPPAIKVKIQIFWPIKWPIMDYLAASTRPSFWAARLSQFNSMSGSLYEMNEHRAPRTCHGVSAVQIATPENIPAELTGHK